MQIRYILTLRELPRLLVPVTNAYFFNQLHVPQQGIKKIKRFGDSYSKIDLTLTFYITNNIKNFYNIKKYVGMVQGKKIVK